MLHWMLLWVLIICCCSAVGLSLTCWGVYLYSSVPWWVLFLIFVMSCSGVLLIVSCWLHFYSDGTDLFREERNEDLVLVPLTSEDPIPAPMSQPCTTLSAGHQCIMKQQTKLFPI